MTVLLKWNCVLFALFVKWLCMLNILVLWRLYLLYSICWSILALCRLYWLHILICPSSLQTTPKPFVVPQTRYTVYLLILLESACRSVGVCVVTVHPPVSLNTPRDRLKDDTCFYVERYRNTLLLNEVSGNVIDLRLRMCFYCSNDNTYIDNK